MIHSPKPLIAAVNGPAIGIGVTSLGLNDLIYSVPHATFHTPFMRWGLAAEGCSSYTFPLTLGHPKAAALLIAGEVFSAEEMCAAHGAGERKGEDDGGEDGGVQPECDFKDEGVVEGQVESGTP